MARNPRKKKKGGAAAPKVGGPGASSQGNQAAAATAAAPPLGAGRVVRTKVAKPSAKEQAALAKKAARASWAERMTAEGR